jgi:uncharacterized damage-inducible protein DinB
MKPAFAILALATLIAASVGSAQSPAPAPPDTLLDAVEFGGRQRQALIQASADLMTEADYAFRPTPEIRTFGQVVAHIADLNYLFCAQARGERPPVVGLEKANKSRDELRQALRDSYAYCESVSKGLTPQARQRMVTFGKTVMSTATLMEVVTLHNIHMYGTMVVYLRLRGKVPPPMV